MADGVGTFDDWSYVFEVVDVDLVVLGVFAEVVGCVGVGAGGQRVDHGDIVFVAHERVHDVGPDESGAAGDDDAHQWHLDLFERETQREARSAVDIAHADVPVVSLHEASCDREAEPGAIAGAPCLVAAEGDVEDTRQVVLVDPAAGVLHRDVRAIAFGTADDRDGPVTRRVSNRVLEDVAQRTQYLPGCGGQLGRLTGDVSFEDHSFRCRDGCRRGNRVGDEVSERNPFELEAQHAGLRPAELEEIVDELRETVGFDPQRAVVARDLGGVGHDAVFECFGQGLDPRERGAEIM